MTTQSIGQMELLPADRNYSTISLRTGISGIGWIARPKPSAALEHAQQALTSANEAQATAMTTLCAARSDADRETAQQGIAAAEQRQDLTFERLDLLRFLYRDGRESGTRAVVEYQKTDAANGLKCVVLRFDGEAQG